MARGFFWYRDEDREHRTFREKLQVSRYALRFIRMVWQTNRTYTLTMAVLRTGSQYMDWPTYMQEIIIGVVIIIAVGVDKLRQRSRRAG